MIFWRDVREVGACLLILPVWIFMGVRQSLPWTWYLVIPVLFWIAGFILADRLRHKRRSADPAESLRSRVSHSLEQVEHQMWLLRNLHWWYLLPIAVAVAAFFAQVTWREHAWGWWTALALSLAVAIVAIVLGFIYWLNQFAVRESRTKTTRAGGAARQSRR